MWLREGYETAKDAFVRVAKGVVAGAIADPVVIAALNTQFAVQNGVSIQITPDQSAITFDVTKASLAVGAAAGGVGALVAGKRKVSVAPPAA